MSTDRDYSQNCSTGPIQLSLSDLKDLEEALKDTFEDENIDFQIEARFGDLNIKADSIKSLLTHNNLRSIEKLQFKIYATKNGHMYRIDIYFYQSSAEYGLNSDNEGWLLSTKRKLDRFFSERRPWYWRLKGRLVSFVLSFSSGILLAMAFTSFISGYTSNNTGDIFLSILFFLISILFDFAVFKESLFPFVQIIFSEEKPIDYARRTYVISLLTLIVAAIGTFIVPLLLKK